MNASLTPLPASVASASRAPLHGMLAGTADRLAQSLPAGACVRVDWHHPALGRGHAVSAGGEPPATGQRLAWSDGDGGTFAVMAVLPQDWPVMALDAWMGQARQVVEQAVALELAHDRIDELRRSEQLGKALYEIADLASGGLDLPVMLKRVHAIIGTLMYAENFYIVLFDNVKQTVRFAYFVDQQDSYAVDPEREMPVAELENSLTYQLLMSGQTMRGPSHVLRAQYGVALSDATGPDAADWLGVPMWRDGRVTGALVVQSYEQAGVYTEADRVLLVFVAQHVMTALERREARKRLEERVAERTAELQRANEELQVEVFERQRSQEIQRALFRIAELSMTSESLAVFYAEVHDVVSELLYARNFYIAMLSDDGTMLEFPYSVDERDLHRQPRKLSRGMTEYVLRTGKPLLADRERIAALEAQGEIKIHGSMAHCWLGVPLWQEDRVVGVIAVQSYSADIAFYPHDQDLLTFVSFHIGSSLARKQAQDRLVQAYNSLEQRVSERTRELAEANAELLEQIGERVRIERKLLHQTLHDPLTGLPNRLQLLERLAQAIAHARQTPDACFAVLFMDLDRFKVVNDSMGHAVGDELLIEAGRRIVASVRSTDVVARLGGDEFAILADGLDGPAMAEELGMRVLDALNAPIWIAGRELFPGASIGIAMWHPRYRSGEEMLRDADAAMYRAKAEGRDRCVLFDEQMHRQALRSLDMEMDLRRAIQTERFVPYYQPIVALESGATVGHEALLRWHHEQNGLLVPGEFLDVGEDSGLIEQIDWLMYTRVVHDVARNVLPGYVAINVSPLHFRAPDFAERLLNLLDQAGVAPVRVRVEITEVALLDDAPRTRESLALLKRHGVCAQLDDFGTGFSALSYLHRFPITSLKIDRSFVSGLESDSSTESVAVIRAIVALAGSLGIELIAEGVETRHQRDRLQALGCHYGQGFLFSPPVPLPAG
ncbi:EAL domain-containing protein [Thermomonas hydrothermalis]|uniref:EAL domain-containing protein n=1 Tax=Thermomonas hydrothermalis TaxID=213588 RepID=UPI0023567135|nr:EAL domain-containing protein [Thermomonas hydrothermalis]